MSQQIIERTFAGDESGLGAWDGIWQSAVPYGQWAYQLVHIGAPGINGIINFIRVVTHCYGYISLGHGRIRIKSHGGVAEGSAFDIPAGPAVEYTTTFYSNPIIGGAWTVSDLADLQIGIGMMTDNHTSAYTVCNFCVALVDFTPIGSGTPQTAVLAINANGTLIQLAPSTGANYQCVDEASPDDSDYVRNSVANTLQTDIYGLADPLVNDVLYVVLAIRVRRSNTYTSCNGSARFGLFSHGVYYYLPVFPVNFDAAKTFTFVYGTNPYTGSPWTAQEITDLQVGVSLSSLDGQNPIRCTWVNAYVAFATASGGGRGQVIGLW